LPGEQVLGSDSNLSRKAQRVEGAQAGRRIKGRKVSERQEMSDKGLLTEVSNPLLHLGIHVFVRPRGTRVVPVQRFLSRGERRVS